MDIPNIAMKKHVLLELTPSPFGCQCLEINPSEELSHM